MSNDTDILLSKWLQGGASREDILLLESLYDLESLRAVLDKQELLEIKTNETNLMYRDFQSRIESINKAQIKMGTKKGNSNLFWIGLLISGVIFFSLYYFTSSQSNLIQFETPVGKIDSVLFADDTKVILGPRSYIEYDKVSFVGDRNLRAKGQVYIDVPTKGPLMVHTSFGKVEVTGTQFSIDDYAMSPVKVHCYEGSVNVFIHATNRYKSLTQNQGIRLDVSNEFIETVAAAAKPDWVNSKLILEGTPMSEVIFTLQRYYDKTFDISSVDGNLSYNGILPLNDLDKCLNYIEIVCKWKHVKKDNVIKFN